jgi:peptide/nickel transport system substrate-binding protein
MYWLSPLADPDDFVYLNYSCGSAMNPQKYCSPALDALLNKARYSQQESLRKHYYTLATQMINSQEPLVATVNAEQLDAYSTRVQGYVSMRTGMYGLGFTSAWLKP